MWSLRTLGLVLLTAAPAAAQLVVDEEITRRMARLVTFAAEGRREVSVEYGAVDAAAADGLFAVDGPVHRRLGAGAWTLFTTDVELRFGERRIPAGRWYLGVERAATGAWSLTWMATAKVDAEHHGAGDTTRIRPDARVALAPIVTGGPAVDLQLRLARDAADPARAEFVVVAGTQRATAGFVMAIGEPAEVAAPPFAMPEQAHLETTPSGLGIEMLRAGEGPMPTATSRVRVRYVLWLTDGTVVDSSYARGQPIDLPLDGVIAGWREGLQRMAVGSISRLVVPPQLGYGERGVKGSLPPNATLVFQIELLEIDP